MSPGERSVTCFVGESPDEVGVRITGGEKGIEVRARPQGATLSVHSSAGLEATIPLSRVTPADVLAYVKIASAASKEVVARAFAPVDSAIQALARAQEKLIAAEEACNAMIAKDPTTARMPGLLFGEIARLLGASTIYAKAPDLLAALQAGRGTGDELDALFGLALFSIPAARDLINAFRMRERELPILEKAQRGARVLVSALMVFEPTRLVWLTSAALSICRVLGRGSRAFEGATTKATSDAAAEDLARCHEAVEKALAETLQNEILIATFRRAASDLGARRPEARPSS